MLNDIFGFNKANPFYSSKVYRIIPTKDDSIDFIEGFDVYQSRAAKTAIYPGKGDNLSYPILGLVGEAGEVAEKYKKIIRDKGGNWDSEVEALGKELGDVLWYIANIADDLGINLSSIAMENIEKVESRKERGVLGGSGDDR